MINNYDRKENTKRKRGRNKCETKRRDGPLCSLNRVRLSFNLRNGAQNLANCHKKI